MNKNAVALAADSAVTIGSHLAIHNSANKLFNLSKVAPVGVIIYANADLMGVPVEVIIKQYKTSIQNKTFPTLRDYVNDFLRFLVAKEGLFHFSANETLYIRRICQDLLGGMFGDYDALIRRKIEEVQRDLTPEELFSLQDTATTYTLNFVRSKDKIYGLRVENYISEKYRANIEQFIKQMFNWVNDAQLELLTNAVCEYCETDSFREGYVGLSFAGYGDDEIFPHMIHIRLSGIINRLVRYNENESVSINEDTEATITPLAQTDVIQTFLFGINDKFISQIGQEIPKQIQSGMSSMDDALFAPQKKREVLKQLNEATKHVVDQIIQKANEEYLFPITQSVATLPIEELALLAESMINITSLRRKVALDNNIGTVGGPIDVAIISKCDGFIWMKRKHYFNREYNPQYFYTHYSNYIGGNFNEQTTP